MTTPRTILPADPHANYAAHKAEIDAALLRTLDAGWYILGKEVAAFEQEFAAYIGAAQGVGVANGTDAIVVGLKALGVGPGDAVFTVSHTAVATVAAIALTGATPVLVDIDETTFTMSPAALKATILACRTTTAWGTPKAIVPVHLYGQPADMTAILAIASEFGLCVLEDCAQAHGAAVPGGRRVGSLGQAAAFSLYPTKNLGALGDGGILVATDATVAEQARLVREYGWKERYVSLIPGLNSRLDEIQAAILRLKLRHLDAENDRRRAIAARYNAELAGIVGLRLPVELPGCRHVYHQYVVRTPQRDALRAHLKTQGIIALIHYPMAVHQQPAYAGEHALPQTPGGLPATDAVCRDILSLPMHPQLSDADVTRIIAGIRDFSG